MQQPLDFLGGFPAGLATGVLVALITLAGKYFFDYRLQSQRFRLEERQYSSEEEQSRWRLRAEARQEVYTAVGSTQSNLVRAAAELHDRLSNFLENPDTTRTFLVPSSSPPEEDLYYPREFVRRLFNFYAWGRITQDAINALPVELVREREDLKRLYTFVNLAKALITYTWLFTGAKDYDARTQDFHLFTGYLTYLTEIGLSIEQQNNGVLTRTRFDELYNASESPFLRLRELLVAMYAEETELAKQNLRTAVVLARFATLRAALAAYLSVDHAWALALDRPIDDELNRDLRYASRLAPDQKDFSTLVSRNFGRLIDRYRCEWLPVGGRTAPEDDSPN